MKKEKIILISFLALIIGCQNSAQEFLSGKDESLPSPPDGFCWVDLEEIGGACLKPKEWHFSKRFYDKEALYWLTKEELSPEGEFLTGLTIQVSRSVPERTGRDPSVYAMDHLTEYGKDIENLEVFPIVQLSGGFWRVGATFRKDMTVAGKARPFIIHKTIFANDTTGTLYVLTFGCPAEDWKPFLEMVRIISSDIVLNSAL